MKPIILFLFACLFISSDMFADNRMEQNRDKFAITNVTIHTETAGIIEGGVIIIEGQIITFVGQNVRLRGRSEGYILIDGTDMEIYPLTRERSRLMDQNTDTVIEYSEAVEAGRPASLILSSGPPDEPGTVVQMLFINGKKIEKSD